MPARDEYAALEGRLARLLYKAAEEHGGMADSKWVLDEMVQFAFSKDRRARLDSRSLEEAAYDAAKRLLPPRSALYNATFEEVEEVINGLLDKGDLTDARTEAYRKAIRGTSDGRPKIRYRIRNVFRRS